MRLGVIGDIHGNIEALTAVYEQMSPVCDRLVCTGDAVGYGASPGECIDLLCRHKIASVRGNHDHYTIQKKRQWKIQPYAEEAILWTRETLSNDQLAWLRELPYKLEIEGVGFVHSSLEVEDGENWPYILNPQTAMFHFFIQETMFCFYGHTHLPLQFLLDHGCITFEFLSSREFELKEDRKYLLNPGSVGQPRDFDSRASAVIFDTKEKTLELLRIDYDVDSAQKRIRDAGLPEMLAERLSRGR